MEYFGFFCNVLDLFGFFWILLSLQAVSADYLCRLSLQDVSAVESLNTLESFRAHHEEFGIETRRYSCSFSITQLSKPACDRLWSMLKTLARTQRVTAFSGCYFLSFLALLARAQGVYLNEHF